MTRVRVRRRSARRDASTVGSSFDDWLKEEGIFDEVRAATAKAVLARQLAREMKRRGNETARQ